MTSVEKPANENCVKGIISCPDNLDVSGLVLPSDRLETAKYLALKVDGEDQRSNFLWQLVTDLAALKLYALNSTLWIKQTGEIDPTTYHSDVWARLPFENRVIQLWIPLVCEGERRQCANAMLRLDPTPLPREWGCPPGTTSYANVWTGEQRELSFEHGVSPSGALLREDLVDAFGGDSLNVGDSLLFDSAYCHYSLPSDAFRVGIALRIFDGLPTYNGYFNAPRMLKADFDLSRKNCDFLTKHLEGYTTGQAIPMDIFNARLGYNAKKEPGTSLLPGYRDYAQHIAQKTLRMAHPSAPI